MTTWIQSLSWTLIYSLGQGFAVYALLWLALKLIPARAANARYHLSLSALTILLGWFAATWWQQLHSLMLTSEQLTTAGPGNISGIWMSMQHISLPGGANVHSLQSSLSNLFPWLCAFYVAGLAVMLTKLSAGMWQLFSLRKSGTFLPDASTNALFDTQKKRMKVSSAVRLLISAKAQVPMVIGFLKPIVLVPAAVMAQLDTDQLESILMHELAHIRRNDYLVNILQTIAETILFFNPFVWIISRLVRREREHCCDDLVIENTSEPLSYATALTALAARKPVVPPMAMAASGQPTHLYNRIQRIMEVKKTPYSYSRMVATLIIIGTIGCSIAWIKPSFTGAKKNKGTTTATKKASTSTTVETAAAESRETPGTEKEKSVKAPTTEAIKQAVTPKPITEENMLIQRLLDDKLIDQVKGFTVEKRDNKLIINGQQQTDELADRYLSTLKKKVIRVQVFRLEERLRMHPNADLLQLLLPYSLESPCVDKAPVKDGC